MTLGYNGKLYILAFDHRGSFQKKMFGIEGDPTPEQTEQIADAKHLIFEGLLKATEGGVDPHATGCLVDEQFGVPKGVPEQAKEQRPAARHAGREVGPERVRLRVRRRLRRPHREVRPRLLQGAGALQPGGRRRDEHAPVRAAEAARRLAPRARPEVPVRAARARRGASARAGGRRRGPLRRRAAPGADAPRDRRAAGSRDRGGHLEDRGDRHAGGLRADLARPAAATAATA